MMTRKISGLDELLAKHYKVTIPEAEAEYSSLSKASVDVSVWLVGLATAVIAFLISRGAPNELLQAYTYQIAIVIFCLVVLFGVIQRILFHIADIKRWTISLRLRGALIGLTDNTPVASTLQDHWTVTDIVARLREDFGVDYSFLIKNQAPIEFARDAYNNQLEIHREFEQRGLKDLSEILSAHYGLPKDSEEYKFGQKNEQSLEETRRKAQAVNRIYKASAICYFASAVLFIFGVSALAIGAV